jgi:crotonobetainyl-CoA:carnitine CoA-transferase CaiB-like acyl-CoA transferase
MTLEDYHWRWFVEAMGSPEWATDPRWGDAFERMKYADELEAHLIGWLMNHTKDEIMEMAQRRRCPFVKVHNAQDLLQSPHLRARDYFVEVEHPEVGVLSYPGAPAKLYQTPWQVTQRAPLLGEHNEHILCGRLGYSKKNLADLRRAGVI